MGFVALTSGEVQVDQPITSTMMTKVKDNFDFLYSQSAGGEGLNNPSFEIDADADKVPDNWTKSAFSGGAASLTTVSSYVDHGSKAMKFTHPGGNGNGGGQLHSDYVGCSTGARVAISFSLMSSPITCRSKVNVDWYNNALSTIGNTTIFDSSALTTAYRRYTFFAAPPTSAKWAAVNLIGGTTESTVAGAVYFDNIGFEQISSKPIFKAQSECGGNIMAASMFESSGAGGAVVRTVELKTFGNYRVMFEGISLGAADGFRVKINTTVMATFNVAASNVWTCFEYDATGRPYGDQIQIVNTTAGLSRNIKNLVILSYDNGISVASTSLTTT